MADIYACRVWMLKIPKALSGQLGWQLEASQAGHAASRFLLTLRCSESRHCCAQSWRHRSASVAIQLKSHMAVANSQAILLRVREACLRSEALDKYAGRTSGVPVCTSWGTVRRLHLYTVAIHLHPVQLLHCCLSAHTEPYSHTLHRVYVCIPGQDSTVAVQAACSALSFINLACDGNLRHATRLLMLPKPKLGRCTWQSRRIDTATAMHGIPHLLLCSNGIMQYFIVRDLTQYSRHQLLSTTEGFI